MDREQQEGLGQFGNPWQGFGHPEHRSEEYEGLLRTLRFALIQLSKFWVEVNAFPVFMNEMKGASIRKIERLFLWLEATPRWSSIVTQPRLVADLKQPQLRAALMDFMDFVRVARQIRAAMGTLQSVDLPDLASLQASQVHLAVALALTRQLGLDQGTTAEVSVRIDEISVRIGRNDRLQAFFSRLVAEAGFPEALNLRDAGRVFQAIDFIRRTKPGILAYRKPQILGPSQRIRIEAWQDRARPAIEARKRLQAHFRLDQAVEPERLRTIAAALKSGGAFRSFSAPYKEALRQYQELLQAQPGAKGPAKEGPEAMAEKLGEWASYLEQKAAFESNAEAAAFFAPNFRGIDTDFGMALQANAWAASLRGELKVEDASTVEGQRDAAFCARLLESVFTLPEDRLQAALETCSSEEAKGVQAILLEPEYATGRDFASVGCEEEARLVEATRLREAASALGIRREVPLARLADLRRMVDERIALIRRMEGLVDVKASLKTLYAAESTDIAPLEAALAYVEYIEAAGLPESLRNSFLATQGPTRLADTQTLVAPARNGLVAVKDHLQRLEAATHGQSRSLEDEPLLDLLQRIQRALKHPGLLEDWVEKLRAEGRWKQ